MADVRLKAGGMGVPDDPATVPSDFVGSMAQDIETALCNLLWNEEQRDLEVDDNSAEARQRRLLFCAIAQGVVAHLKAHPEAFVLTTNNWHTHTVSEIRTQ